MLCLTRAEGEAVIITDRRTGEEVRVVVFRRGKRGGDDTQPDIHVPAAYPALFKASLGWDLHLKAAQSFRVGDGMNAREVKNRLS